MIAEHDHDPFGVHCDDAFHRLDEPAIEEAYLPDEPVREGRVGGSNVVRALVPARFGRPPIGCEQVGGVRAVDVREYDYGRFRSGWTISIWGCPIGPPRG